MRSPLVPTSIRIDNPSVACITFLGAGFVDFIGQMQSENADQIQ